MAEQKIAIVLIRSTIGVNREMKDTLEMLKLVGKNIPKNIPMIKPIRICQ